MGPQSFVRLKYPNKWSFSPTLCLGSVHLENQHNWWQSLGRIYDALLVLQLGVVLLLLIRGIGVQFYSLLVHKLSFGWGGKYNNINIQRDHLNACT